jgi:hypothetical protein
MQEKGLMPLLINMLDERFLYKGGRRGSTNKSFHWLFLITNFDRDATFRFLNILMLYKHKPTVCRDEEVNRVYFTAKIMSTIRSFLA